MLSFSLTRHRLLLIAAFWTAVALIYAVAEAAGALALDRPFGPTRPIWILVGWYTWIPASIIALHLVHRFPVRRSNWPTTVPLHLTAAVANSMLACILYTALRWSAAVASGTPFDPIAAVQNIFYSSVALDAFIYLMILLGVHALRVHRLFAEERLRSSELSEQLTNARLHALKMQLHPHFLFNTFNSISMLVRRHEERQAVGMITQLSDFFRFVLEHADLQEVKLDEELLLLRSYLSIEKIRFGERLSADIHVEDDAKEAYVPTLLLQPLVENAVRHGIEPVPWPGVLVVRAWKEGDRLEVSVRDNGQGLPDDWSLDRDVGIGLANTRLRLERLYGSDHHFAVRSSDGGRGSRIEISIPYRTVPSRRPEAAPASLSTA